MIKINLLPPEMRIEAKVKKKISYAPFIRLAIIGLVLLTGFFFVDFLESKKQFKVVAAQWQELSPQMAELKAMEAEIEGKLKTEKVFLESSVVSEFPVTTTLEYASELLPDRMWLTELKVEKEDISQELVLQGVSLPSDDKTSIQHIQDYLHNIRGKLPDAYMTLTTARQTQDDIEVTTFVSRIEWGGGKALS